ncbi:MAG TPA: TetR/AcrR family transcriptional regulator [Solirubrobacterales bacterium]
MTGAPTGPRATRASRSAPRRGRPSSGARERILEAAIEVLKAEGYAGLTIAKVATAAGESKPLVPYHYGSKQGLVKACGREVAEMITAAALDAVGGATKVEEVIEGAAAGVERVLDRDDRVARLYFDLAAVSVVDPEIRKTITEVNEQWRVVLTRLLSEASDGPSPARARVLTVMVIAGIQGLTLERIERGATPELRRARELFVRGAVAAASG